MRGDLAALDSSFDDAPVRLFVVVLVRLLLLKNTGLCIEKRIEVVLKNTGLCIEKRIKVVLKNTGSELH